MATARWCEMCNIWFRPTAKRGKYCEGCLDKRRKNSTELINKTIYSTKLHNCPYLKDKRYCTHRDVAILHRGSKANCKHVEAENCKYYEEHQSKLKASQKALK